MASTARSFEQQRESSTTGEANASIVGGVTVRRPQPARVRAVDVGVANDRLTVELEDGRTIIAPLERFPRLIEASDRERADYVLLGDGTTIHWPAVDEDIDVANLLRT